MIMQRYIYKYTKIRPEFFRKPIIRATQIDELNDPFEALLVGAQLKRYDHMYKKKNAKLFSEPTYMESDDLDELELHTKQSMDEVGVISFTEDPMNTIMWSHYGDNHKGMIIQLKKTNLF